MTEHEIEEMKRIDRFNKKVIHYLFTILFSILTAIFTTLALTR